MMKLVLFGIFAILFPAQSYKGHLLEVDSPFTYVGDKPSASWVSRGIPVAYCKDCPSSPCTVHEDFRERITANCDEATPIFHSNSTPVELNYSWITCPASSSEDTEIRVGRYDGHLHSDNNSTVALEQHDFTLFFDKRRDGYVKWINEHCQPLIGFDTHCTKLYGRNDRKRLNFTCDEKTSTLHIKNVTLIDDGDIFACSEEGWEDISQGYSTDLSLFRLTVNVPVTSVAIQPQSQVLVENAEASFVCKVEESKPEASFKWIILYQNGSTQEIYQKSTTITKALKGKLWQTNSTLTLSPTRYYHKIMCKSTIVSLPWTNSEYQLLDIKVPVTSVSIQPQSQVLFENQEATFICQVEESKPESSFKWNIVYQNGSLQEINQGSTTISKKLNGNVWQTNSTLKLNLTRDYQKIMCKATIETLPWRNSEYQSLDIKDTNISNGATIVYCVIAVIIVSTIIIGGFLYFKFKGHSRQEYEIQPKDTGLM